ncbi:MAG: AAA family ATPase, partial [Clostridia bacterium]|nr:AAA family ATPase [Clostridia bacterium]
MKILSINITEFGGLSSFKLDLADRLNIIEGKNESGKSTILLFIMYILYGLPKSTKKNTPGSYDKARSLSWSGSRAEGSMEIESEGIHYRIERSNLRRTATSEAQITDLDAGTRVFVGKEPGEVFLGVSRETFESCLWCGQSRASAISAEKLTETLSNLSLTADESVNGEAVLGMIRNARKQYKHERGEGGSIFEISSKINSLNAELERADTALSESADDRQAYTRLESELGELNERIASLDIKKKAAKAMGILARLDALEKLDENINNDSRELATLDNNGIGKYAPNDDTLNTVSLINKTYLRAKAEYDQRSSEAKKESELSYDARAAELAEKIAQRGGKEAFSLRIKNSLMRSHRFLAGGTILTALAFASVALGFIIGGAETNTLRIALLALGAVIAAGGVTLFALSRSSRKAVLKELSSLELNADDYERTLTYRFEQLGLLEKERAKVAERNARLSIALENLNASRLEVSQTLERYGMSPDGEGAQLSRLIFDIQMHLAKKKELSNRLATNSQLAKNDRNLLSGYSRAELEAAIPEELRTGAKLNELELEISLNEATEKRRELEKDLVELKIKINSSGTSLDKRADLESNIAQLEKERETLTERYNVLDTAYRAVEEAYGNMRRSFAPSVRESAGKLLDDISGGKYTRIFLSGDFDIGVEVSGTERAAGNLSTGTSDALYVALRLALIENIFGCPVP